MTSETKIFSQQEMGVAIKKMKENKAVDESGGIAEYIFFLLSTHSHGPC